MTRHSPFGHLLSGNMFTEGFLGWVAVKPIQSERVVEKGVTEASLKPRTKESPLLRRNNLQGRLHVTSIVNPLGSRRRGPGGGVMMTSTMCQRKAKRQQ